MRMRTRRTIGLLPRVCEGERALQPFVFLVQNGTQRKTWLCQGISWVLLSCSTLL